MAMKQALIVVDYQKDFVTGALGFPKAERLEGPIRAKIEQATQAGVEGIFTLDKHPQSYLETQEGKHLPIPHCLETGEGWKLQGTIAQYCDPSTPTFEKRTFGSLSLANYLAEQQFDQIELVGVVSDMCVFSNALLAKAACPEADIRVDAACIASPNAEMEQKALALMQHLHIELES